VRYLSEDELKRFLRRAKHSGAMKDLMMALCFYYAMRVQELVQLRMTDLNMAAHQLTVHGVKGGHVRTYDLPYELVYRAQRWLRYRPSGSEWLFPSAVLPYQHVHQDSVKAWFKAILKAAGLCDHSIHDLRSSRLQQLASKGDGLPAIAAWARHKSLGSALRYLTAAADKRHEAIVARRDTEVLR
jgi:integrase